MSTGPQDAPKPSPPLRSPPLLPTPDTPDPAPRVPPLQLQPTNWKKICRIVGLSLLGTLAFLVIIGALIFGGCMFLIEKTGH